MENNIQKIENLIKELNYYTKLYDEGYPIISDKEWDNKYFELVKLEKEFNIYNPDSPTQSIPFEVVNKLKKVEHNHPMLSLDKTKSVDDVKDFIGKKDYIIMSKMDGLTCSLTYNEKGFLIKAETRGNGIIGEDILHNAFQIRNIPKRIKTNKQVTIDGEVICTYENFEKFKTDYKNPRNFASGSIRLLDSEECASRKLSFIAWDCIEGLEELNKLSEKLNYMSDKWSFDVVPYHAESFNRTIDFLNETIDIMKETSVSSSYPIDGVVFKYDNCKEYLAQGSTDHHLKGGLAYKFYDEEYETKLLDIEWGMGRTSVLTPVAIFETIDIEGSEVNRASLHNISVMKTLLHGYGWKNQKIFVYKSNMIIPQISRAEIENLDGNKEFEIPHICPICGGETIIKKDYDSEMLYCDNPNCQGKLINILDHFCGKKGLDIKGLSKATLGKLIDWGYLNNYKDIFTLREYRSEWIKKPGFGVKSVDNILNAIEGARNTTLDKVISASGIPEIGSKVAKDLAKHYNNWQQFREEKDFYHFDGIGEIMNLNLLKFDYSFLNLEETINNYLNIENKIESKVISEGILNKTFCITGKTHIYKNRKELSDEIEQCGGRVVGSVSGKVDYLINNDVNSTSSKNIAAKRLNIPIITEEEYQNLR